MPEVRQARAASVALGDAWLPSAATTTVVPTPICPCPEARDQGQQRAKKSSPYVAGEAGEFVGGGAVSARYFELNVFH